MRNAGICQVIISGILLLLIPYIALAASFSGKVVKVSDGDTIEVMRQGRAEKIRLAGIDCPEIFWTILTMSNGVSGVVNETQSL